LKILSYKPGHDGHIALVENFKLTYSYEAEKDSNYRYSSLEASNIIENLMNIPFKPDIISISGWTNGLSTAGRPIGAGYWGIEKPKLQESNFLGQSILYCSSSHERSHILCSYALSPFPQGEPCYALVWEGHIGCFYEIDSDLEIKKLKTVMVDPGIRYSFAYALADPTFNLPEGMIRIGDAGKFMALAAFFNSNTEKFTEEEIIVSKRILDNPFQPQKLNKKDFVNYKIFNSGPTSDECKRLCRLVSESILNHCINEIKPLIKEKRPLLISGGCGLNCEWNSHLKRSELFSDVFVPPCTNDTGVAIGSAADAQFISTGNAKLNWSVYCGQDFIDDLKLLESNIPSVLVRTQKTLTDIALDISNGSVYAWANGRCEIGPRALGNRSLLASPLLKSNLDRLNRIKQRENYRPIAPICLAEDYSSHFSEGTPNPFMLYFSKVQSNNLPAITHVDGSARPQTVTLEQNPLIYTLLKEFKKITNNGVLCNTSLNFNGKGFINRSSDLVSYVTQNNIDGFVLNGILFLPNKEER